MPARSSIRASKAVSVLNLTSRSISKPIHIIGRSQSTSTSAGDPSSSRSTWSPVLPSGTNPAYDAALSFLSEHKSQKLDKLAALNDRLKSLSTSTSQREINNLRREISKVSVEAEVNDPATRRLFKETNGKGFMELDVIRYLAKRSWEREGELDLLMQRVHQLNVVPDLIPIIRATNPFTLYLDKDFESTNGVVEPGLYLPPSSLANPPKLTSQLLQHPPSAIPQSGETPTGLYTLLVVDPDSPDHTTQSFNERLHYLKTDISLSVISGDVNLFSSDVGKEILSWEPPTPPQGSSTHRYVFILIQQSSSLSSLPTPLRSNFSLRNYLASQSLSPESNVVGINLVRAKWTQDEDEYISATYKKHREEDIPVYGKPPKETKYGYPLSAKAARREEIRQEAYERAMRDIGEVVGEADQLSEEMREKIDRL